MKKLAKICTLFGLALTATAFVEITPASTKIAHAEDTTTEYVAEDGDGNKYASIYDIYVDDHTSSSIKLLSDVYLTHRLSFGSGIETFDFNGHTVYVTSDYKNLNSNEQAAFYFEYARDAVQIVDMVGGGGINTVIDGYEGYIPCFYTYNMWLTLNIQGGTYVGQGEIAYSEKGDINIYGGSYEVEVVNEEAGNQYLLNCYDAYAGGLANIKVYGGTFKNYNPATDGNDGSYLASGYVLSVKYTDDGYETVASETAPTTDQVSINGTYYATLNDALKQVKSGETIVFNEAAATDGVIEGPGIQITAGHNLTIDLNGLTYEINNGMTGSTGSKTNGWHLLKGSDITIKNGTLTKTVHYENGTMLIQNYSNLTLDNVKLIGDDNVKYVLSSNHGNIVLKNNTEITAIGDNIAVDICYWMNSSYIDGVSLTIEDSSVKINGTVDFYAYGGQITEENKDNMKITIPNDYTLTLADGLQLVSSEDGTTQEVIRTSIYNAQQFAKEWKAAREVEGGLCGLVGTSDMTELLNEYDALDSEGKSYLASVEDADGCTISESIAYFKTIHEAKTNTTQNSNRFLPTNSVKTIQPIIIITVLGLLSIVAYYFIQKRKNA
mgnify:CR=1 FL=1